MANVVFKTGNESKLSGTGATQIVEGQVLFAIDGEGVGSIYFDKSATERIKMTSNADSASTWNSPTTVYVGLGKADKTVTIQGGETTDVVIGVDGVLNVANGGTGVSGAQGSSVTPVYLSDSGITAVSKPISGAWWSSVPSIDDNGAIEIGKYIDFHYTNNGTTDYDVRITASKDGLDITGTTTGTFSGSLAGNATTATSWFSPSYLLTDLESDSEVSIQGKETATIKPGVTGVLPVKHGGTGVSAAVGSLTQPVYLSSDGIATTTYSLSSTIDAGTANRIAWYKTDNEIAATTTHYISDTKIHVNSTDDPDSNAVLDVNGNTLLNGKTYTTDTMYFASGSGATATNYYIKGANGSGVFSGLCINQKDNNGAGISLYGTQVESTTEDGSSTPNYGIFLGKTATFNKYVGSVSNTANTVTGTLATYFRIIPDTDTKNRGWIFRNQDTNVVAIGTDGGINLNYLLGTQLTGSTAKRVYILPDVHYSTIDSTHVNETYLKALIKWICTNYPNVSSGTWIGTCTPNSCGYVHIHIYATSTVDSNGYPQYASGNYYALGGNNYIFGFYSYTWYFYTNARLDSNVASASKLEISQSFDIAPTAKDESVYFDGTAGITINMPTTINGFTSITSKSFVGDLTGTATQVSKSLTLQRGKSDAIYYNGSSEQTMMIDKIVTQAEYDALGNTVNSDNITYYISDGGATDDFLSTSGGTITGGLTVNGNLTALGATNLASLTTTGDFNAGPYLKLWSDTEGGNIRIINANDTNNIFEFDRLATDYLRLYASADGGPTGIAGWQWYTNGVFQTPYLGVNGNSTSYRLYVNGSSYHNGTTYHNGELTQNGQITFPTIATWPTPSDETYPINSSGLYWNGSSDWAKIYYSVSASDLGNLCLDVGDDTNAKISFRQQGTEKSYICNGRYYGNVTGALTGNADTATMPLGFSSRSTGATWGNTTGTSFTCWNDSTGGSIDFRQDNPSSGKVSIKVDGRIYVNEGSNAVMGMTYANSFWGMGTPDGSATSWIRTTSVGIIPYQSGSAGGGHSSLGTSSWYFSHAYIDAINAVNIYGSSSVKMGGYSCVTVYSYGHRMYLDWTGSSVFCRVDTTNFTLSHSSDKRLKKEITSIAENDKLKQIYLDLNPVYYKFIEDGTYHHYDKYYTGLVAQDLIDVFNKNGIDINKYALVNQENTIDDVQKAVLDGDKHYYSVDYNNLHALHIMFAQRIYKELTEEIEQLKEEIKNLKEGTAS